MCKDACYINYLEISRDNLEYNAEILRKYIGVPIIGVIKCNGYGVSVEEAAEAWRKGGVTMFAVSKAEDAVRLKEAGFNEDILLMTPVADVSTLNLMQKLGVILTVTGIDVAEFYMQNATKLPIYVHVAVDTGMGRFGVRWTDLEQLKSIYKMQCFYFIGIFSHFSASFERKYKITKKQLNRFLTITRQLDEIGCDVGIRHIANSCAALRFPETWLDAVRVGSALVGELCSEVPVKLKPVAVFKAQVVDCRRLVIGDTTGYASVCKVKRNINAVVVAIGHENGFGFLKTPDNFNLRNMAGYFLKVIRYRLCKSEVMYKEEKLQLIGRVGSQYSLFDATGINICPGDYVTAKARMMFPHQRRVYK